MRRRKGPGYFRSLTQKRKERFDKNRFPESESKKKGAVSLNPVTPHPRSLGFNVQRHMAYFARATLRVCAGVNDAPQAPRRGGNLGRVGFDTGSCSPWDGRSSVSHPTSDIPFRPRGTSMYRKGMISARPTLWQGVKRSVWDPETLAQERRHALRGALRSGWCLGRKDRCLSPPVSARRATWLNGESRYSTRCRMLGPERPEAVLSEMALYLPTLLIVNKLLSLARAWSLYHFSCALSS
jgi:hypothetical protein